MNFVEFFVLWCRQLFDYFVCGVKLLYLSVNVFFFKQKTAYEMRISDWSSDVCSSDLVRSSTQTENRRRGAYGFRKRSLRFSVCPRQGAAPSTVRQQRQSEGTDMEISEFHIIGRIGKAAIMDKVAFLDIASNYRRKVDDEWVDDTHWTRVTFFGKHIARENGR